MTGTEMVLLGEFVFLAGLLLYSYFVFSKKNVLWNAVHQGNKETLNENINQHHKYMAITEKLDKAIIRVIILILITLSYYLKHVS